MPSPNAAETIGSGDGWVKIFDFEDAADPEKPRGYVVANPAGQDPVEVFVIPLHGEAAPGGGTEGMAVYASDREAFYASVAAGGSGNIRRVYARVPGGSSTFSHGALHDEGHFS